MWFQAVTAGTHFEGNVFFNGPRAAVNWNDGFGGGDELLHNLLINTCRESGGEYWFVILKTAPLFYACVLIGRLMLFYFYL